MRFLRLSLALLISSASAATTQPIAFPGAEGFGALATGGRGGKVVHVTTLDDSGPGSLRDAVSEPRRIVVFDVGGVINLKSPLDIRSDVTIAGQSAPGDGIAIYGNAVSFSGSSNIVVRYLRFREGMSGPKGKCSINMNKCKNIILDHCSIEWGRWDCMGPTESSDITVQWCIIGEGIDPQRFGCLCESDNITFSHNLWIDNQSRNPKAKGKVQYVNNVVYNWGVCGLVGGHSAADHWTDVINCYFVKGPSSSDHPVGEFANTDHVFQSGNLVDENRNGKLDGRELGKEDFGAGKGAATLTETPGIVPPVAVAVDPAEVAFDKVLVSAGASLHRDAVDAHLIDAARSLGKDGEIIHDEKEVGGEPALSGGESKLKYPDDPTRIEEFLNSLVKP
jgi:pectate lyase